MVHVPIIQSVIWTCTCLSLICFFFNSVTVHIPIVYFFSLFAILCIKLILKTYEEEETIEKYLISPTELLSIN